MPNVTEILTNTDFTNISLDELMKLEEDWKKLEESKEKETLKKKFIAAYGKFATNGQLDRELILEAQTGYKMEGWGKYSYPGLTAEEDKKINERIDEGWNSNNGWKFHLDVVPNRSHPVTKSISDFLINLGVAHKVADGGENGKGMTVYVGSYDDINKLAKVIEERFGKDIYEPPLYTDQVGQEHKFERTVYGRFVPGNIGDYPWDGIGIGPIYAKATNEHINFEKTLDKAVELGIVKDKTNHVFADSLMLIGETDEQKVNEYAEQMNLRLYCSHKLYADALGEYYCGANLEDFEQKFFGDKIPQKGSAKRQKWDEIADAFVAEAKEITNKKGVVLYDFIKSFTDGYKPIDFSRVESTTKDNNRQEVDFTNISLDELMKVEDGWRKLAEGKEKEELKWQIIDAYRGFIKNGQLSRESILESETGYKVENWGKYDNPGLTAEENTKIWERGQHGWDANQGWKFHLDVVPNRSHPVTKSISDFLINLRVGHKIADGGVNGKGMTVYVGSYKDINKLAKIIEERFGKDIYEPPLYTDQVRQEHKFEQTVYGRFVADSIGNYPRDGIGISPIHTRAVDLYEVNFEKTLDKAVELGLVKDKTAEAFSGKEYIETDSGVVFIDNISKTDEGREQVHLRHYCSHKLYAAALGEYYYGDNLEDFEQKFFGDKLPPKGSAERQKWDEVADAFVAEAKEITIKKKGGKTVYDFCQGFGNGYIPVDFSRVADVPSKNEEKTTQEQPETPTKVTAEEHVPAPTPQEIAVSPQNQDFKTPWRKFYQQVAKHENSQYSEDTESPHYKATLQRTSGEKLEVTATKENRVSISTKDTDGKRKIPSYEDFNNLVLAAKEQGKNISFGNIKTPEYKARLMLACLENGVDIKELPAFESMRGLEPETKQRLTKHKIKILKQMAKDKETTGNYGGMNEQENINRQRLEKVREVIRHGKTENKTDTPEYKEAKQVIAQRVQSMKEITK